MTITTIERLRELLNYNPETGELSWRVRRHGVWASKNVIHYIGGGGYLAANVEHRAYRAHRLAWALHYGEWPKEHIDHINGIKTDNRIVNLREATIFQNRQNSKKYASNSSGYKGVSWSKFHQKWYAYINADRKRHNLGYFDDPATAYEAYKAAAQRLHGEFANLG